jgi:DNA-binding transcriptional ArsR family regulator
MFDQKIIDFLRLSKNEVKVSEYLKTHSGTQVADISRGIRMPRMTVYLALDSLKARGLADYFRKGKRRFWSIAEGSKLVADIMSSAYSLTDTNEIRINAKNSGFAIHQGLNGMYRVWKELQKLAPNSRVYGIQPTGAMRYALKRLDWQEKIAPLQENILKKPIIIDGVLPEDYYPFFAQHYSYDKKLQRKMLESFLGRGTDMTFMSDQYFKDAESELIILPNVAYLSDWKNEVSIEIRNPAMLLFLKELYDLAKGYGRKVNQEEYIKKMIAGLEKKQ